MNLKKVLYDALGLACCLIPPIACTCAHFPVWEQTVGGWAMVGGTMAIVAVIVFIVVTKFFRARVKSPSPVTISLFLWMFLTFIEKTVTGLKMVAFWMFLGSLMGAFFFWLGGLQDDRKG